jgi:catechol 2,3-dioxygenase-like lactoylglutathione lyase family enzyme
MTDSPTEPVIKPSKLSHGTLECHDLKESRRFYVEFLGLECVRHGPRTMMIRKGGDWSVVCVNAGDKVHPQHYFNHWGIDVGSREEVDAAHAKAVELKDEYGIKVIADAQDQHGVYSFYLEDLNSSWWEVQYLPDFTYDELFERGDAHPM